MPSMCTSTPHWAASTFQAHLPTPSPPLLIYPMLPLSYSQISNNHQTTHSSASPLTGTEDSESGSGLLALPVSGSQWQTGWVSERGSQCFAQNTCGPFGLCKMTPAGSLDLVQCTCPEGFEPIDESDVSNGCVVVDTLNGLELCAPGAIMKGHEGVDMPWGGGHRYLNGSATLDCSDQCLRNCSCFGAVYSKDEQRCWLKNGTKLYNLGYPTVALHGTDRTAYIKISTNLLKSQSSAHKRAKLGVILGAILGGAFCICVGVFCVYKFRNSLCRVGGVCSKKTSHTDHTLQYPGPDEFEHSLT